MKSHGIALTEVRWTRVLVPGLDALSSILIGGLAGIVTFWAARSFPGYGLPVLLASLGFWLITLLSVAKFDWMVFLSFCLFGFVVIEPAPVDLLLMMLFPIGVLSGKLSPKRLEGSPLVHIAMWGLLIANLISVIPVASNSFSLRFLVITLYMMAFFYFVKLYTTSAQAMRYVMMGYLVSALISVFLVILGYLGVGREIGTGLFVSYGLRAKALFKGANIFASFLVPMIIFLVDEVLQPDMLPGLNRTKVLGIVALSATLVLSFSRAALATLAVSLAVYLLLAIKDGPRTRIAVILIVLCASLLVGAVLIEVMDLEGFLQARTTLQDYDMYRFERQRGGIIAGLTHPVGVGPGMWFDAHSLYVRTFAEHGILGLVSLLLLIAVLLKGSFVQAFREVGKPYGISARFVTACLVGQLFDSLVIDHIHWRHFWLIAALAWVVSSPPATNWSGSPDSPEPASRLATQ